MDKQMAADIVRGLNTQTDHSRHVTRAEFEAYERVRQSGQWNMLANRRQAAKAAGLSLHRYDVVLWNYTEARSRYGSNG